MANVAIKLLLLSTLLLFLFQVNNGQIHRATNQNSYQIKYDQNFNLSNLIEQFKNIKFFNYNTVNVVNKTNNSVSIEQAILNKFHCDYFNWIASIVGTFLVGVSGIIPAFVLPRLDHNQKQLQESSTFKCLISFAAGSLLADVFIHLLPEAYSSTSSNDAAIKNGLWTLTGIVIFFLIEKLVPDEDTNSTQETQSSNTSNAHQRNDAKNSIAIKKLVVMSKTNKNNKRKFWLFESFKIIGLLNLIANIVDNFTHGIAVAGSFQAGLSFGLMTLFATLLHEIPHEVGDFVILLRSGLNFKQAAVAQLITAFSGIFGAVFALSFSSAEKAGDVTSWILPFTSGGFLYISLASILPELLSEKDTKLSLKQIISLNLGILTIYWFSLMFH